MNRRQARIRKILIVGLGSIGCRHLRIARTLLPSAEIRVLRRSAGDVPEGANGCITDMNAAMEFDPQIAVIATPAPYHISAARPLAERGVHLLVEKPLAQSARAASDLSEVCGRTGSILMTGYNLRFLPSLQQFAALLGGKVIGTVLSVRAEAGQYLPSWRPDTDYRASVSARRELGGGVLLELSHEIDYIRWIFGEVTWVQAVLRRQSTLDIDVEDTAHLTLGLRARSDLREVLGSLSLDFARRDPIRQCTAVGEKSSLRWNGLAGTVEKYESGAAGWATVYEHRHERDDSYIAEWEHFISCVHGEAVPRVTGEDGLAVLRIIDAARLSSDTQSRVRLEVDSR